MDAAPLGEHSVREKTPRKWKSKTALCEDLVYLCVVRGEILDSEETGLENKVYFIRQITPPEDLAEWIQTRMHTISSLAWLL